MRENTSCEKGGGYRFRSTAVISSRLNINENEVRKICGNSYRIRRNEKDKEIWTICKEIPNDEVQVFI